MRKVSVWVLAIPGLVGLLMAVGSFKAHSGGIQGPDGKQVEGPTVIRMGFPDTWVEFESRPDRHITDVYFIRWSFGILLFSVCALCSALLMSRRTPFPKYLILVIAAVLLIVSVPIIMLSV